MGILNSYSHQERCCRMRLLVLLLFVYSAVCDQENKTAEAVDILLARHKNIKLHQEVLMIIDEENQKIREENEKIKEEIERLKQRRLKIKENSGIEDIKDSNEKLKNIMKRLEDIEWRNKENEKRNEVIKEVIAGLREGN